LFISSLSPFILSKSYSVSPPDVKRLIADTFAEARDKPVKGADKSRKGTDKSPEPCDKTAKVADKSMKPAETLRFPLPDLCVQPWAGVFTFLCLIQF